MTSTTASPPRRRRQAWLTGAAGLVVAAAIVLDPVGAIAALGDQTPPAGLPPAPSAFGDSAGLSDSQPGRRNLTAEERERATAVATRYADELAAAHEALDGLQVRDVGPVSDGDRLIGVAVVLELPEPRDVEGLPQIDLRRADGRFHSTEYAVSAKNMQSLALTISLDTDEIIGLYMVPTVDGPRPQAEFEGDPPDVPIPADGNEEE